MPTAGRPPMMDESYAALLELVADIFSDSVAVIHGDNRRTWAELDERASRLASYLAQRGVEGGTRVGICLYNSVEYVETLFAILKLGATPVNINYRYRPTELVHIFTDSGATAAVLDSSLLERIETIAAELPKLATLLVLGDDFATELPTTRYEDAIAAADR